MASHTQSELREAARVLARAARAGGRRARPAARQPAPRRAPSAGRRPRRASFDGLRRSRLAARRSCAASSSPGPTPASASRSSPRRSARRWRPAGERVAAFKPAVTGLDERRPASGRATTSCSRGGERRASRRRRWRPTASGRRCRRTTRPSWRARRSSRRAGRRGARAAAEADVLVCEGVGGLLVPLTPGYLVRDLARGPRAAAGDRGAARARHDQPHAADHGGGARGGAATSPAW